MELGDYEDSADYIELCYPYHSLSILRGSSEGDTVSFGAYEQDNDLTNGKEEIEWIVLAKEDNRLLLINRYALDCQQYNTLRESITWENCSLRKWLNESFYNEAFDSSKQELIALSEISADKNPVYSVSSGNDTQDNVFLLSISEAELYFGSDFQSTCTATTFAFSKGAYKADDGMCWW